MGFDPAQITNLSNEDKVRFKVQFRLNHFYKPRIRTRLFKSHRLSIRLKLTLRMTELLNDALSASSIQNSQKTSLAHLTSIHVNEITVNDLANTSDFRLRLCLK